jgi:hypothetical protein
MEENSIVNLKDEGSMKKSSIAEDSTRDLTIIPNVTDTYTYANKITVNTSLPNYKINLPLVVQST